MFRVVLRLCLTICLLTVAGLSAYELAQRHGTLSLSTSEDLAQTALHLATAEQWAEANELASFVRDHPDLGDTAIAESVLTQTDAELNSFSGKVMRFTQGALSGEPKDTASFMGSLSLDLFVIGDIRDLVVQGWKQAKDGSGDEIILALSAIGLATTLLPEIDWAPSMLKAFKRSGSMTKPFAKSLKTASRQALKTRDFSKLGHIVTDIGKAGKRLGPGPLRGVMRHVDNASDLRKIAKAAAINATDTYVVASHFGKAGIKRIGKNGSNVSKLAAGIKAGSRVTKIGKKSFGALPDSVLGGVILFAIIALLIVIRPWRLARRRSRVVTTE